MSAPKKIDEAKCWSLYNAGKTDLEIATECGLHINTVNSWRKRNGLPVNRGAARRRRKLTQLEKDAIEARKAGMTYGQYKAQQILVVVGGKIK